MPVGSADLIEKACIEVVLRVLDDYRPRLLAAALKGERLERANTRHDDNFLSDFDMRLHDHYRHAFAEYLPAFVYLSEEGEPEIVGSSEPEIAILVDPLDTSELAVRGLHGYTHVLAYSMAEARPLVAVVGDFYHEVRLYVGISRPDGGEAQLHMRSGEVLPIHAPVRSPSDRLLVTSYNMRPAERFVPLAKQTRLMDFLTSGSGESSHASRVGPSGDYSRVGVDFGSVGFCHVATGATDVFLEFAKGFALWDLLPGQLILECAGGVVTDLDGSPLPWPTEAFTDVRTMQTAMGSRQTFVAAGTAEVAQAVAGTLNS